MAEVPSDWRIMKALAGWREARNRLLTADLWADENELGALLETEGGNVNEIVHRLLRASLNCMDMADKADRRIDELTARRDRYKTRTETLRTTVLQLMETLGEKRFIFPDVTATHRAGRAGVKIIDLAAIPAEYKRTTTEVAPDKAKLLADLNQGVVIDGAELSNGAASITIRTK